MHGLFRSILIPSLFCLSFNSFADKAPSNSWTFTLRFENDLFAQTDQYYTNGIKLNWISPDLDWFRELPWLKKDEAVQNGIDRILKQLPYSEDTSRQRHVSLSVGQLLYTPADIKSRDLIPDDRPYAGWLYGSAAFHSKTFFRLDTFEILPSPDYYITRITAITTNGELLMKDYDKNTASQGNFPRHVMAFAGLNRLTEEFEKTESLIKYPVITSCPENIEFTIILLPFLNY